MTRSGIGEAPGEVLSVVSQCRLPGSRPRTNGFAGRWSAARPSPHPDAGTLRATFVTLPVDAVGVHVATPN